MGHAQLALELGIVSFVINVLEGFPSPLPTPPVELLLLLYCELSVLVFYVDLDPGLLCLTGLDDTVCCHFSPPPFSPPSLLASLSSPKALGAKQLPILWNFYVE